MYDSMICARYAIIFSGNLAKEGAAIESTKPLGEETHELISRILKERPKHTK
jgi:hypothetical protein